MSSLKFYEINKSYVKYLKNFDKQIPDVDYESNNKFTCGVVLNIDGFDYFAPVSSFNKSQQTNLLIYDKGRPISSIRFSFMMPVPKTEVNLCDFDRKSQDYKDLVNAELKYCKSKENDIFLKAMKTYKIGTNRKHPLAFTCCDFKLLEEKCNEYEVEKQLEIETLAQVAITKIEDNNTNL